MSIKIRNHRRRYRFPHSKLGMMHNQGNLRHFYITASLTIDKGGIFTQVKVRSAIREDLMSLEATLYRALLQVSSLGLPPGLPSSGTKFEDFMVKQLHESLQQSREITVFPPRYTLHEPTHSGCAHNFDIVVRENNLIAIECKFRRKVGIGELFAFMGKLIDYQHRPRAVFLTTASISEDVFCYSIAHQISIVCPFLPPVQYMLQRVGQGTSLTDRLETLQSRLIGKHPPRNLLIEWQSAHKRFQAEGYG